ncbi:imidazole glycerol phosphate synthase subunit HisH [Thorsellia kenyensis]|uniref:Imidazole glycerol phosphate synthase subunit HisH n=1 Tax=Thorsellia kenyensis TaxID=1549888 RepID=A0ABV6CCB0_9GAMM
MRSQPNLVIVNTGCANLTSVNFAFQRLGIDALITDNPDTIRKADKVLLPGVGTAKAAMMELKQRELIEVIGALTQPVLGICLGMQLLTSFSQETSGVTLLNKIKADTLLMEPNGLPVPHCGWNQVIPVEDHPLFFGISQEAYFYFVHSYAVPIGGYTLAKTLYGNQFSAAIMQNNFIGVQFHPERSGKVGSQLLKNFVERV